MRKPDDPGRSDAETVRSEEELEITTEEHRAGSVRARKVVDHEHVTETVEREVEQADVDRVPATEADTGEVLTLEDGALSIPVFEERLVVEKRRVVTERIVIRKHTVTEDQLVEADLARERVEVSADPEVSGRVHADEDLRAREN